MADYPDHPDDPNRDVDFINLWQNVVNEMMETDFTGFYYEDWLDDLRGYFKGFDITTKVSEPDLIDLAHACGVRQAHNVLSQAHLDSVEFALNHMEEAWFIEANKLFEQINPAQAWVPLEYDPTRLYNQNASAKIFLDHGIRHSFCCHGYHPGCPLQAAINFQISIAN